MIVCGHSKVEQVEGGWRVYIDEKIAGALNLFPGQNLFGEDIMGSLASVAELFSSKGVNILSSGAFGLGNIWVSEYIADFKDMDVTADDIVDELEGLGGFVTSREITEFFPQAFELESTYEIKSDEKGEMYMLLTENVGGVTGGHAILKAWADIQALFIDFLHV